MGGGNALSQAGDQGRYGLSPRGRGKRRAGRMALGQVGSIPAWAGETSPQDWPPPPMGVYPRVGGGNPVSQTTDIWLFGLSPRGRGKRIRCRSTAKKARSIPAWAGETTPRRSAGIGSAVYPRVGGGNAPAIARRIRVSGLSPRGRGKRVRLPSGHPARGSIPAWAGETPPAGPTPPYRGVYPRVGGGNPSRCPPANRRGGLSPRGRGKPVNDPAFLRRPGSIPAWAGETASWP